MVKLKWSDIPIIIFASITTFGAIIYTIIGTDLFPGDQGGRWVVLMGLDMASALLCIFVRINEDD